MTNMNATELTTPSPFFSKAEIFTAFALYPIAYIYTLFIGDNVRLWLGVFVLLFVSAVEYLNRGKPIPAESWIWLGCMAVITLCVLLERGRAWSFWQSALILHALAVWWTLSRSGSLLEACSGRLLPADAFNGLIRLPFGNFFMRLRCIRAGISAPGGSEDGKKRFTLPAVIGAIIVGALLLYLTASNLAAADDGFNGLISGILVFFAPDNTEALWELFFRFLISLPVAAWLFGLIFGSARMQRKTLDAQATLINRALPKLRIVPQSVWIICSGAFIAVYLLFFVVQGGYIFGAFSRSLPEGFTVAEYARQGFFELCRVMTINFILLWLITRTGTLSTSGSKVLRFTCTLLLAAGMLFAAVALSKLSLYISCFGLTPKRLQSSWLALVLLFGSGAATYSLWSGKRSFRAWLIFAAVTLTLLHVY